MREANNYWLNSAGKTTTRATHWPGPGWTWWTPTWVKRQNLPVVLIKANAGVPLTITPSGLEGVGDGAVAPTPTEALGLFGKFLGGVAVGMVAGYALSKMARR